MRAARAKAPPSTIRHPGVLLYRLATGTLAGHVDPEVLQRTEWETVEWDRVLRLALLENAVPSLHEGLVAHPEVRVPPALRQQLDWLTLAWTLKLALLERRIGEAAARLAGAGIEATLLKGAALALTVYGGFRRRPMADVDLLVDESMAADAHRILQQDGWRPVELPIPATAWDEHHHLAPLADTTGSGLRLEVHRSPLEAGHAFIIDGDMMRHDARAVTVGGASLLVPEPHVHAVHAAMHFAWAHRFDSGGLNAVRDLLTLHDAGVLDWGRLAVVARETSAERCTYWTLRLAQATVGLPVPDGVLAALAPPLGARTLRMLEHHFLSVMFRERSACPSVQLRKRLWALGLGLPTVRDDAPVWLGGEDVRQRQGSVGTALSTVTNHLRRAPDWSRYAAGMIGSALEATS